MAHPSCRSRVIACCGPNILVAQDQRYPLTVRNSAYRAHRTLLTRLTQMDRCRVPISHCRESPYVTGKTRKLRWQDLTRVSFRTNGRNRHLTFSAKSGDHVAFFASPRLNTHRAPAPHWQVRRERKNAISRTVKQLKIADSEEPATALRKINHPFENEPAARAVVLLVRSRLHSYSRPRHDHHRRVARVHAQREAGEVLVRCVSTA